jgi:hypothetical protein
MVARHLQEEAVTVEERIREALEGVIRIDLGGGSLVSDNITLTPEQTDVAMQKLMDGLQRKLRIENGEGA